MGRSFKSLLKISLGGIAALAVLFYFIYTQTNKNINHIINSQTDVFQNSCNSYLSKMSTISNTIYQSTLKNKAILDILSEVNNSTDIEKNIMLSDELKLILKPSYKGYEKYNISSYTLFLNDNKIFLNMEDNFKYDDSVVSLQQDVLDANENNKIIRNFEQNENKEYFYTSLYPITDSSNNKIGLLKISFSDFTLKQYFKEVFDSFIYISDENIESTYSKILHQDKKRISLISNQIKQNISKEKAFSVYSQYKGTTKIISFYPVFTIYKNKFPLWLVSYKNDTKIGKTIKNSYLAYGFTSFITLIGIIILFAYSEKVYKKEQEHEDVLYKYENEKIKVSDLEEELSHEKNSIEELKKQLYKDIENLSDKNEKLTLELERVSKDKLELEEAINNVETTFEKELLKEREENEELSKENNEQKSHIEVIENQLKVVTEKMTTQEEKLKQLTSEYSKLITRKDELKQQVLDQKTLIKNLQQKNRPSKKDVAVSSIDTMIDDIRQNKFIKSAAVEEVITALKGLIEHDITDAIRNSFKANENEILLDILSSIKSELK